jgi:hypothetical protein
MSLRFDQVLGVLLRRSSSIISLPKFELLSLIAVEPSGHYAILHRPPLQYVNCTVRLGLVWLVHGSDFPFSCCHCGRIQYVSKALQLQAVRRKQARLCRGTKIRGRRDLQGWRSSITWKRQFQCQPGRLDYQETGIRFPVGVQTRLNTGFEACSEGLEADQFHLCGLHLHTSYNI